MSNGKERTRRAIAKRLVGELVDLKGSGLITPGYWLEANRETLVALLTSIADEEAAL